MEQETKELPTNILTAEELLRNKGLKYNAWDEYEKSAKTLPRNGMKQFEPDNSWLESMQIEKGIMTHKNLIAIDRVDRISQLASAEWLSTQKRAKVKKYSGQDWSNFGLEKNGTLYLIPEEALFLLEANCLELTWNDVPLSIQQAYDLLIDNVECSLEEYRVYSQLVRHGYRIQRYIYDPEKWPKVDESNNVRRKVIVEPENGLWMTDSQQLNKHCTSSNNTCAEVCKNSTKYEDIQSSVYEVVDDLLSAVENIVTLPRDVESKESIEDQEKLNINLQTAITTNNDQKKRKSKVEIISEETLLGNFKIVKDHLYESTNDSNASVSWRASRIQRNVKLLPKRTDKIPSSTDKLESNTKNSEQCPGKHRTTSPARNNLHVKKVKHEVIELSDDEIEEVPKPMTRMDLLNLIPNIASQTSVKIKISRGYIPHNIKPCKTIYYYECAKLRSLQDTDRRLHANRNSRHSSNENQTTYQCNNNSTSNNSRRNTNVVPFNQNLTPNVDNVFMQDHFSIQHRQHTNFSPGYVHNRMPHAYNQNLYWDHGNTTLQNVCLTLNNQNIAIHQSRYTAVQLNNTLIPHISNNIIRNFLTRNQFYHHFHQNVMPLRRLYNHRLVENVSIQCSVARNVLLQEPYQRYWPRNYRRNTNTSNHEDDVYQSAFTVLPEASSWSELKNKWRENKTITIDDEDTTQDEKEDCNEVQIVRQLRCPLVGPKNANNLEEVFSKLNIIKSAPEKTVRRRKSKYKISYNVYSSTQNYRKSNPGAPFYRVIVIRPDDPFIQPIELQRLLQDADNSPIVLACVSMSISYIQPGFISIPNLT